MMAWPILTEPCRTPSSEQARPNPFPCDLKLTLSSHEPLLDEPEGWDSLIKPYRNTFFGVLDNTPSS